MKHKNRACIFLIASFPFNLFTIEVFLQITIYSTMMLDNHRLVDTSNFNVLPCNGSGLFLRLRSMLYVLQSGKSAAIYACAQEQGFEVLEVMKLYCFWGMQHLMWQ